MNQNPFHRMGTFLVFMRKHMFCCLCIAEEEESEPPNNGCQNTPEDLLSSDLNATSRSQLVSQTSAISSGNTASFNDWPNDSHRSAEKKQASIHFSDTAIKKISPAASKEKLIYLQKATTEPGPMLMKSKKIASSRSDSLSISSCNSQNKQLSVEPLTRSYCGSLRIRPNCIEQIRNTEIAAYFALITMSARLQSEFDASPKKQNSQYEPKFIKSRSGPHEKVSKSLVILVERKIQDYSSSQKILLVGEGDFSFSACLARAFGSATNMVATSLDSEAYLRSNYKNAMDNMFLLRMRGCKVFHEVDATDIKNHKMIKDLRFDRIIYNFPHAGHFSNTNRARRKNQKLVRLFMENSVKIMEGSGEIHIRHKSNPFFLQWNLKGLASQAGLVLNEEVPFDASELKGYNTKYGFEGEQFSSDHNFDCHPSLTYKFVLSKNQKKLERKKRNLNASDVFLSVHDVMIGGTGLD